jgi:polar amino acid transport system substrate-binding protein
MIMSHRRLAAAAAAAASVAIAVSACGAPGPATSSAAGSGNAAATAQRASLPASIRQSGVLRVGTNVPFVPMEQPAAAGQGYAGIDIDLIGAVAQKLGLKVQITNANWDGLIPSLNAGRYDVLASSFGDFVERQKVVDMVDMLRGGVSGIVPAGQGARFASPSALCGATVGVESGSATVAIAQTLSAKCQQEGKASITQRVFPADSDAMVALQSGRVEVVLDDRVVATHLAAAQPDRYQLVLPGLGAPFLYAFVVGKQDQPLSRAIEKALNELIADGSYAKICARYGISGGLLVKKASIDAGTTSENAA